MFDVDLDRRLMRIALRAARRGRPSPNPHVGAVVARGATLIAVGHHERAGCAHAEIAALARAGARARGATLYVTLEPCNHHGRTGPCTEAILASGVARVVIGCRDPAPHVPGSSARLIAAGIAVSGPVCEAEALRLVADFAKHFTTGIPFVTLAARVGADGRLEPNGGDIARTLGPRARRRWLRARGESDAVLVDCAAANDTSEPHVAHIAAPGAAVFGAAPALRSCASTSQLSEFLRELGRRDVVRLRVESSAPLRDALVRAGHVDHVALALAAPVRAENIARIAGALRLARPRLIECGADFLLESEVKQGAGLGCMTNEGTHG
jgi:pyrimidine deaminase RibD-like protein/riboflavin biosynthesis pyrimidine reductase